MQVQRRNQSPHLPGDSLQMTRSNACQVYVCASLLTSLHGLLGRQARRGEVVRAKEEPCQGVYTCAAHQLAPSGKTWSTMQVMFVPPLAVGVLTQKAVTGMVTRYVSMHKVAKWQDPRCPARWKSEGCTG